MVGKCKEPKDGGAKNTTPVNKNLSFRLIASAGTSLARRPGLAHSVRLLAQDFWTFILGVMQIWCSAWGTKYIFSLSAA